MKRNAQVCLGAVVFIGLGSGQVHAQVIASDSFNLSSYSIGGLNGQAASGFGFTGNWYQILDQDLSIISPGKVGRPVVTATTNSGDAANFANGGFTISAGQLYISYDINNAGGSLTGSRLDLNSTVTNTAFAFGGLDPGQGLGIGSNIGSGGVTYAGVASTGPHHLVGVIDLTNDQLAIFVDPTGASYYNTNGTNDADATVAWTAPASITVTSLSLIDNFSDQATFDNVLISTTGEATGIQSTPEPGTLALLAGMCVSGAIFANRRRRPRK